MNNAQPDWFGTHRAYRINQFLSQMEKKIKAQDEKLQEHFSSFFFEAAVLDDRNQFPARNFISFKSCSTNGELDAKSKKRLIKNKIDIITLIQRSASLIDLTLSKEWREIALVEIENVNEHSKNREIMKCYDHCVGLFTRLPIKGYIHKEISEDYLKTKNRPKSYRISIKPAVDDERFGDFIWSDGHTAPSGEYIPQEPDAGEPININSNGETDNLSYFFKGVMGTVNPPSGRDTGYELLTIPVHNVHQQDRPSYGAFLGWLHIILEIENAEHESQIDDQSNSLLKACWPFLDSLSRNILEGELEDFLIRYESSTPPLRALLDEIPRLTGWKDAEKAQYSWDENRLLPYDYCYDKEELHIRLDEEITIRLTPKEFTHLPASSDDDPENVLHQALARFTKRITSAYKQICGIHRARERDLISGQLSSAHDYSKDLNALDLQLERFQKRLDQLRTKFENSEINSATSLKEEISSSLQDLRAPEELWHLRSRFMMAHLQVENGGNLTSFPEWCLNLLRRGTRGSLYKLIRLLVWAPINWEQREELAHQASSHPSETDAHESELETEHIQQWAQLFTYDEVGRRPQEERLLADYLSFLFREAHISKADFGKLHPPPQLNKGTEMTETILWAKGRDSPIQINALLPILVYSLRVAFQHAWLDLFLRKAREWDDGERKNLPETPSDGPKITLSAEEKGTIQLTFPNPLPYSEQLTDGPFPWGTWERDLERYKKLPQPWSWEKTLDPEHHDFVVTIR